MDNGLCFAANLDRDVSAPQNSSTRNVEACRTCCHKLALTPVRFARILLPDSFHLNLETTPLPLTDVCSKFVEFQRHANISGQRCHRLFLSDRVLQRVLHSYCLFSRCMNCDFCPRDAMLARVLAAYDLVSVSVCHKSVFYQNGWTNRAGFGTGASFHLSYTVFYRNIGVFKNKGTSLWNFDPNSGFKKNRHSISHRTSSSAAGKVTVGLASHWPCVTDFSVFFHLLMLCLSVRRFCRAGQLATADTCCDQIVILWSQYYHQQSSKLNVSALLTIMYAVCLHWNFSVVIQRTSLISLAYAIQSFRPIQLTLLL